MKNLIYLVTILIILLKTGNVLSSDNIFNVNNIEVKVKNTLNKQKSINEAFKKGFDELTYRLLLEDDYKKYRNLDLTQVKELISHYQIEEIDKSNNKTIQANIFFDKKRMHDFFFGKNIFYSDFINSEVIIFPLLIEKKQYHIYSNNFFVENWTLENDKNKDTLINYILPLETIENIEKIKINKDNIYDFNISEFFEGYDKDNIVFAIIEKENYNAKVFLNCKLSGKKLKKTLLIKYSNNNQVEFNNKIILEIKNLINDLIKSQNLIDVRTPSFLNVKINLKNQGNLVELNKRFKKIDLIDNFYVQQLNKDYALIKIKYLGKINKFIQKLNEKNINLLRSDGKWQLTII